MFTRYQIKEIAEALQNIGAKDSSFPKVETLTGNEEIALLKDRRNYRAKVSALYTYIAETLTPEIEKVLEGNSQDIIDKISEIIPEIKDYFTSTILPQLSSDLEEKFDSLENLFEQWWNTTVTLSVTCGIGGAQIFLNNTEVSEIVVPRGSSVNILVTANGYSNYYTVVNIWRDTSLNITLEEATVSVGGETEGGTGDETEEEKSYISVEPETLVFDTSGTTQTVNIKSNDTWIIS